MSRTDKDQPYWMLSEYWAAHHESCQYATWRRGRRECDLPPEPIRQHPERHNGRTRLYRPSCTWWPTWDYYYRPYGPRGVPTWFVRAYFTRPDRRRVRDECDSARQEYNATGEVDTIPSVNQHRHQARRDWW